CAGSPAAGTAAAAVPPDLGVMHDMMPCTPPAILEANGNLSCRCLKSTRAFIPPERYSSIEVWPVGSSCRRPEVVIKLKSLKRVCVDPDTPWMKKLLQDLPHL
uniref:Chemokine interleukin-8-like domain-containing protein n=1 Tax=Taeniopygia guttata TaxID=59729 RepID=A0A674HSH6_TAEGU